MPKLNSHAVNILPQFVYDQPLQSRGVTFFTQWYYDNADRFIDLLGEDDPAIVEAERHLAVRDRRVLEIRRWARQALADLEEYGTIREDGELGSLGSRPTSQRKRRVDRTSMRIALTALWKHGADGVTCYECEYEGGFAYSHGGISAAFSFLHEAGVIRVLKETRSPED